MRRKFRPYQVPTQGELAPYLRETPVRIEAMIRDAGMILEEAELEEGVSSTLEAADGRYRITLSTQYGDVRRRFAAAYELARVMLDRSAVLDHPGPHPSRLFEAPAPGQPRPVSPEAERLALALLLPAAGLREMHAAGKGPREIADACLSAPNAVVARLRTLSLKPHPDPVAPEPSPAPEP
jgi:hypothetical protein